MQISEGANFIRSIKVVSQDPFVCNGNKAVLSGSKYEYEFQQADLKTTIEIEKKIQEYIAAEVEIDVSTTEPYARYTVWGTNINTKTVESQLQHLGMIVESIDDHMVVFRDRYNTYDEFKYVFPMRTMALFDVAISVNLQISSFFSDKCKAVFLIVNNPKSNISLRIKSQENSKFSFDNADGANYVGSSITLPQDKVVDVTVTYSNITWFVTIILWETHCN